MCHTILWHCLQYDERKTKGIVSKLPAEYEGFYCTYVPSFISKKRYLHVFGEYIILNSHSSLLQTPAILSKCMSINGHRQKRRNNTNREGWNTEAFEELAVLKRKGGIIPLGGMEHYRRLMEDPAVRNN